jgi:hypothetical protein
MFTVIVPTMWKYKPFYQFLDDMLQMPSVGEVIIINNNPEETPDIPTLNHPNVNMISFGKNIYVNQAWNAGVELSKYDKICLYGDDLIFDLKLFNRMVPHISPDRGVYGISPGVPDTPQIPFTTGSIDIVHSPTPYHYRTHLGFGMLMFLHKKNWVPVIDGIDLYWGDNFVYDTQFFMMNQNYLITNLLHHTPYAATTSTISNHGEILERENYIYNRDMPKLLNDIRVANAYRTGFI